ncbi:hypothetical protein K504DRAFT_289121 [Pleomassaria siparia CBS 279.74]|uniref:Uncharacterized protein n=1 Tax=Pleomassaria siparia CBS 279.74 TaxID=1314801 RepID=A0A6G1K8J8_9PLEO|nr:hypothetical protein K504DRAFT_289121 [Pleomassaria siparia CBS 279.74]
MGTLRSVKKLIHPTTIDKNNPYAHPSHPNHDPKPVIPVIIKPPPRPRPVTDRDLLVQARIASGRDPETGRMIVPVSGNQTRDIGRSTIVQGRDEDGIEQVPRPMGIRRRLEDADMTPGIKTKEEEEEANMSMYNARASRQIKKTGNRYDLFVQEMALQLQYPSPLPPSTQTLTSSPQTPPDVRPLNLNPYQIPAPT